MRHLGPGEEEPACSPVAFQAKNGGINVFGASTECFQKCYGIELNSPVLQAILRAALVQVKLGLYDARKPCYPKVWPTEASPWNAVG